MLPPRNFQRYLFSPCSCIEPASTPNLLRNPELRNPITPEPHTQQKRNLSTVALPGQDPGPKARGVLAQREIFVQVAMSQPPPCTSLALSMAS